MFPIWYNPTAKKNLDYLFNNKEQCNYFHIKDLGELIDILDKI